jgi:hypothetical protein
MKKIVVVITLCGLLASCSKKKGGKELGEEVCECSKKANGMPSTDPNRAKAQSDCSVKQFEAWTKIKDEQKESDAFNKVLSQCATDQINTSFGK